jgi:hypothetical protein
MAGKSINDVRRLVILSAVDDWISDYEVQGDFQSELSVDQSVAFEQMVAEVTEWIRRGVLVPGDLVDGFALWPGSAEELAAHFTARAEAFHSLSRPGQICWFDTGPNAASELTRIESA